MLNKPKTTFKVAKYRILKPVGVMTWDELGDILRETRYRVWRLANMAMTEKYLAFYLNCRMGRNNIEIETEKISDLNKRLRKMLDQKKKTF